MRNLLFTCIKIGTQNISDVEKIPLDCRQSVESIEFTILRQISQKPQNCENMLRRTLSVR